MNNLLKLFKERMNKARHVVVYGAGEYGTLMIQYCLRHIGIDKLDGCIVTSRQASTPSQIMGIPVVELNKYTFVNGTLAIIAVINENIQHEIKDILVQSGVTDIYIPSGNEFKCISAEIGEFSASNRDLSYKTLAEIRNLKKDLEDKINNLQYMTAAIPVMLAVHKKTFSPYYGALTGKEVVVCGCGPTLNLYNFDDGRIHIGTNSILFDDKLSKKLDYYFNQHVTNIYHPKNKTELENRSQILDKLRMLDCIKFVGQTIGERWPITPPYDECQLHDYLVYYNQELISGDFWPDLRYNFLNGNVSVLFSAVQFALFCRPKRIYLVGCDGYANNKENYFLHWYNEQCKYAEDYLEVQQKIFFNKHIKLKEFALLAYPHTDVIMVNPRGFKGIYQETVTDETGYIIEPK